MDNIYDQIKDHKNKFFLFIDSEQRKMSLPENELSCPICLETVQNAVVCTKCDQHFCESHLGLVAACPTSTCRATPFLTAPNPALRKMIDRLRVKCRFCGRDTPRCELAVHEKNCPLRPRQCGAAGCTFKTADRREAMKHLVAQHDEALWDEFEKVFQWGTTYE